MLIFWSDFGWAAKYCSVKASHFRLNGGLAVIVLIPRLLKSSLITAPLDTTYASLLPNLVKVKLS